MNPHNQAIVSRHFSDFEYIVYKQTYLLSEQHDLILKEPVHLEGSNLSSLEISLHYNQKSASEMSWILNEEMKDVQWFLL